MSDLDNKLVVKAEDGRDVVIKVLDIIDSEEFNKTFMIYNVENDNTNIFASILNESDSAFSLDTIESQAEIDYINTEIDRVANENTVGETVWH